MTDLVGIVTRYYDACNTGDVATFEETLDPEVVHWFLAPNQGSSAVGPRDRLVSYWNKVQPMIDGTWVVDHAIHDEGAAEVVIEWSLFWTPEGSDRVVTRGAEWFAFRDDRIVEIRSYYQQHAYRDTQLDAFPYGERGYSVHGTEASGIHDTRVAIRRGSTP